MVSIRAVYSDNPSLNPVDTSIIFMILKTKIRSLFSTIGSPTDILLLSQVIFFLKNGPIPASFCLFSLFSQYNFNNTN